MSILKYAFIASVLLFILVTVWVPSRAPHPPQTVVELILIFAALSNLVLGLNAKRLFGRFPQNSAGRAVPLNPWFATNIAGLAMIESTALFAVVLHMLGSSAKVVGILFGCALIAFVVWNPGTPPSTEDAAGRMI